MPNRLSNENSLYLKQHANNPVDWWPWGPEAFEEAKKLNKPVLVSIGYSACHWCHVMAHESFEDSFIADIMNRNFICIKVDREERPDIDQIYMEAVQMITGHGGWPLNAFCFPDGSPFFGGTYFPPEDRGFGIIPWPQLLIRIVDFFKKNPHDLEENAKNILKNMAISNVPHVAEIKFSNEVLFSSAEKICHVHDDKWGGFGNAPKFPPSMILDFLLATRNCSQCKKPLAHRIDNVITTTLKKMAFGGIYDQIGGGFARYSVDAEWRIPHFEKMLYDNALLIDIYTKAWVQYGNPLFKDIIEETIQWLLREMSIKNTPAFASSLAADSEGKEGKYYIWSLEEIKNTLGQKRMNAFCSAYGVSSEGNFEKGFNHLMWIKDTDKDRSSFASDRQKLLESRQTRVPPQRDDKILTAWNSLTANALVEAGFYFEKDEWIFQARKLVDWIWKHLSNQKGQLYSVHYPTTNTTAVQGFLDDYAFYAQACLALASKIEILEKNASNLYLERAQLILQTIQTYFKDKDITHAGYFFTAGTHGPLVARKKVWLDNAIPCGNSALLHVFSSLYAISIEAINGKEIHTLQEGYSALITHVPNAVAHALSALMNHFSGIIVIKFGPTASVQAIAKLLRTKPYRPTFLLPDAYLKNNYQVCIGTHCFKPTHKANEALEGM